MNPRKSTIRMTLILAACLLAPAAVPADPMAAEKETPAQRDARMKWWRDARFGMFIHWGVYSVPAGTYHGKQIGGIGEWIMNTGKIPVAEYRQFARQFNPVKFDADQWVRTAKNAGMKYIVITSKHHDGFGMFDSKATGWCITKASPFKRDPLKELAAACRREGIKLGFYYSHAQDWNHPGGAAIGGRWDKAQEGSMDEYIEKIAVPQVRELLTGYGPIAVLWWDTPMDMTRQRAEKFLPLLKLQPGIVINDRLGGGFPGDTNTPEQEIPATGYPNRDWETCMTMNDTWGYKSYDHNWKSPETLIHNLVDIASKGGNYLLNVGPTSEGLIPAASVQRLKEVGRWMHRNGEAIYGTTASPFKKLAWGRATKKLDASGATLYLHVFQWPADGRLVVPGLKNEVEAAWVWADAEEKPLPNGDRPIDMLETERSGDDLVVSVPAKAPDPFASVVVLKVKGTLKIEGVVAGQAADGSIRLPASDAICHGEQIRYESGGDRDNIGFWLDPGDWAEWQFMMKQPGVFAVTAEIAALGRGRFLVGVGDKQVAAESPVTGDYGKFTTVALGKIEIPAAGKTSLAVKAVREGWQPLNLKSITLTPVK
jgi:alpha-L-fucosidase